MRRFSIRVVSALMGSSVNAWATILKERQDETPIAPIGYGPIFRELRRVVRRPADAATSLARLTEDPEISARVRAFRRNTEPHIQWFAAEVAPRIHKVLADLEGDRINANPAFKIEDEGISGGAHWEVEWEDGSRRYLYVVGPKSWSLRRVRNLLALLQMYVRARFRALPTTVVIVLLHRHEVWEFAPLDPDLEDEAIRTVRKLKRWPYPRESAS